MSNEVKERAHRKVQEALRTGKLVRPKMCSGCNKNPGPARDGRTKIHGHHHNGYDNPLDVVWLCAKCHRDVTPLPEKMGCRVYGERNGQSKLTAIQVAEIRVSPLGCRRLGRIYGVDKVAIQRIRNGTQWNSASPKATP